MPQRFPKSEKYGFNKNLVKRHKLVTHLDAYLGTEVEEFEFKYEPKHEDDAWHPSGHCTPTVTELYDFAVGPKEKKEWGTAMLKTFMVGHFWHQLLQKAVVDLGFATPDAIERRGKKGWGPIIVPSHLHDVEVDYHPYHWVTGSGDVAPCTIPRHGDYVVDFKTMSGFQFKSAGIPDWAADKYEAQINIYMDFFDIEKALIVCIQKDSPHEMKEFEFVRNDDLIEALYAKWEFVSGCIDNGEPPVPADPENDEPGDDAVFDLTPYFKGPVAQ